MTGASPYLNQPRRAIAFAISAFFLLASSDALVKSLVGDIHSIQVAFFRYAVTLAAVILVGVRGQSWSRMLRTRRPVEHLLRSVCTTLELVAFYVALSQLALPTTISLLMISPIVITLMGIIFLSERMPPVGWASVGVGFIGMLMVVQPTSGVNSLGGTVAAMISVALWSTAQLLGRRLSVSESPSTIMFYYAAIGFLLLCAAAPFFWSDIDFVSVMKLVAIGLIGTLGQYCLLQAVRYGKMSQIAPFEYSSLVWACIFGWIFWGEVLNALAFAGVAMIILACLHISRIAQH